MSLACILTSSDIIYGNIILKFHQLHLQSSQTVLLKILIIICMLLVPLISLISFFNLTSNEPPVHPTGSPTLLNISWPKVNDNSCHALANSLPERLSALVLAKTCLGHSGDLAPLLVRWKPVFSSIRNAS